MSVNIFTLYLFRTSIQCASWCTDFDDCRAFQWKENPETLCTLFKGDEICTDKIESNNIMLFVDQSKNTYDCDDMPSSSGRSTRD